jgi:hypothetical protein
MITFFIVVAAVILVAILAKQIVGSKSEKSIDLAETLLSKEDIHKEIAKTVEEIKSQDPVVIEVPFVAEKVEAKPKKKTAPAPKKEAPKTKATPKKKSK